MEPTSSKRVVQLIAAGVGTWAVVSFLVWLAFSDWPTRGHFGDMFGAANALFSGLALVGVVYAVMMQRQQLIEQQRELRLSAKLNALSALIAAYTERARYFDSRASPNSHEVSQCEARIKTIANELEEILRINAAPD